ARHDARWRPPPARHTLHRPWREALLKIVCIGGGPAGLYFSILMKKANPAHEVVVLERNGQGDTFGWGVVFSNQTLDNFRTADPESLADIEAAFAHWDDIDVHVHGRTITSGGHGFAGIARRKLLQILLARARALGVDVRFNTEIRDEAHLALLGIPAPDLLVAADGARSLIRAKYAA